MEPSTYPAAPFSPITCRGTVQLRGGFQPSAHLVEGVMRHSAPQEDESEREGGHVEHRHDHLAACQSDGGSKGGARFQTCVGGGVCRCEPE